MLAQFPTGHSNTPQGKKRKCKLSSNYVISLEKEWTPSVHPSTFVIYVHTNFKTSNISTLYIQITLQVGSADKINLQVHDNVE